MKCEAAHAELRITSPLRSSRQTSQPLPLSGNRVALPALHSRPPPWTQTSPPPPLWRSRRHQGRARAPCFPCQSRARFHHFHDQTCRARNRLGKGGKGARSPPRTPPRTAALRPCFDQWHFDECGWSHPPRPRRRSPPRQTPPHRTTRHTAAVA